MSSIFADSFESGDVSAWTGSLNTPVVSAGARLVGSYGLEVNANLDIVYETFTAVDRFRIRMWIDPNSLSMAASDGVVAVYVLDGATPVGQVALYYTTVYTLYASVFDDASAWHNTALATLTNDAHWFEVDFDMANATGSLSLWVDGALVETVGSLDLGTRRPDTVWVGWCATSGTPAGTLYVDHYASNDDGSTIGPGTAPRQSAYYRRRRIE